MQEVGGSIPPGSTKVSRASPSSRGPGHRPFTAVTGVRIPLGTPIFATDTTFSRQGRLERNPGVSASRLDSAPMRIRLFGHYWQLGIVLLWLLESAAIFVSSWVAFRWLGTEGSSVIWLQSLVPDY